MSVDATRSAYAAAVGGGAILWVGAMVFGGRTEAWDSPFYWTVSYPLAITLAGVLGYRFPDRPWRWALAVMLAQAVVLAMTASGFGMLPLGLILFAILALPGIALARIAAGIRLRKQSAHPVDGSR